MAEKSNWKTLKSAYVVHDRWLKLRADTRLSPQGKIIEPWYVLEYPEWVNCLVIDREDNVILLDHYRHGADARVLETISGIADGGDASTIQTIKRELHEEIGLEGGEMHKTGVFYANPSNQTNKVHVFLAIGGVAQGEQHSEPGADFRTVKMPFKEFYKMITQPNTERILQGLHLASIFCSLNFIKHSPNPSEQIVRLRPIAKQ